MNTLDKLVNYINDTMLYSTVKVKEPTKYLYEFFKDVSNEYIELIYKHVVNKKIRFINSKKNAFSSYNLTVSTTIAKSGNKSVLLHELGHAIDYLSYEDKKNIAYHESAERVLSNNMTLHDTIKKELKENGKNIFNTINYLYQTTVLDVLPEEDVKMFKYINDLEEELRNIRKRIRKDEKKDSLKYFMLTLEDDNADKLIDWIDLSKFKNKDEAYQVLKRKDEIFREFKEHNNYVKEKRKVTKSEAYINFKRKYDLITDMLSSIYDLKYTFPSHSISYFKNKGSLGIEFFANCFETKVQNDEEKINIVKTFFPNAYSMFLELLNVL